MSGRIARPGVQRGDVRLGHRTPRSTAAGIELDVTGQPGKFSNHSWGRAIDINPLTNPYIKGDKVLPPEGRQYLDRSQALPGSILADSFIVKRFAQAGWQWGGSWSDRKDYQHFEIPLPH